jgi:hypothetical protein
MGVGVKKIVDKAGLPEEHISSIRIILKDQIHI